MENKKQQRRAFLARHRYLSVVFALIALVCWFFLIPNTVPVKAATTEPAYYVDSDPYFSIDKYDVDMTVSNNREIFVQEKITVTIFKVGEEETFYRSLPLEGDQYWDFKAKCEGNPKFDYYIADNPDIDGFLDINFTGGIEVGKTWTFEYSYKMLVATDEVKEGMRLDVVGAGSPVEMNDVTVTMHFPDAIKSYDYMSGAYGENDGHGAVSANLSADKKTLVLTAPKLVLEYNDTYGETMAQAITLEFSFEEGVLVSVFSSQILTSRMILCVVVGVVMLALAVVCRLGCKTRRELITTVSIKAPKDMDPLVMGKLIDSFVNNEDVTSMIFYFASKGYLTINFEDQDDPLLIKKVEELPTDSPAHCKTLFNGLFNGDDEVRISSLKYKYYESIEKATMQVGVRDVERYDKKSVLGFGLCAVIAVLGFLLVSFVIGKLWVGGDYFSPATIFMAAPIAVFAVVLYLTKTMWYKLKKVAKTLMIVGAVVIAAISVAFFCAFLSTNLMTVCEKIVLSMFAFLCVTVGVTILSRTEKFNQVLGDILGFKDFILYTEQDKIKFMLEDNPELLYDILPYAQVLGVTDEWEKKFDGLLVSPPKWCEGADLTCFDYLVLNHCLFSSMREIAIRPESSGSSVGRSGGGGGFGGFSGGGHGGGGFGMR